MSYSSNGNRPKLSEKGLLTPDNCVVALIDHQGQMLFGTSNFDRQGIINNTVAFGKAARVFDVPVILTTVETKSFSGNMWPQLRAVFPGQEPLERSSKDFVAAIEKSGRKKTLIAGLWTEVCVAFPTVQAIHDGILHNAKIATNRVPSFVEAIAIADGKVTATCAGPYLDVRFGILNHQVICLDSRPRLADRRRLLQFGTIAPHSTTWQCGGHYRSPLRPRWMRLTVQG